MLNTDNLFLIPIYRQSEAQYIQELETDFETFDNKLFNTFSQDEELITALNNDIKRKGRYNSGNCQ
jgi:hypothetical protein